MIIILRKNSLTPENLIYIAFASTFMPFFLTGIIIIFIGIYIMTNSKRRKAVFCHSGCSLLVVFTIYTALIGLFRNNYIGFLCSVGFFFIIVIGYYARTFMTSNIFQHALDLCCLMCVFVFLSVAGERIIYSHIDNYRCVGWFFNSNYLCTMMALMIIVCVYKLIITHKGRLLYILTSFMCFFTMYLGGSIFSFIELAIGILGLIIVYKKRRLLGLAAIICSCIAVILYVAPETFPRILESNNSTELRILVWDSSIEFLKINPIFGNGFLPYYHFHNLLGSLWKTTHTHNFLFESILSFGLVGTIIFLAFIWSYYEKVSECKSLLRKNKTTNLILAVSTATIIHCTVDLTILWIQTGFFFILILSGIGVDEKTLNRRIKACLARSQKSIKTSEEEINNE